MILINILLPLITGLVLIFLKRIKLYWLSLIITILCLISSVLLLFSKNEIVINWVNILNLNIILSNDIVSSINVLLSTFFTFVVILFSKNVSQNVKENIYFSFIFLILSFTNILFLSKNLIVILISWEILGILVYFMIRFTTKTDEYLTATKTLITLGITDFCLFTGMILLMVYTKKYTIGSFNIEPNNYPLMYTLLIIGTLGKVGSIPLHNWIPDTSEKLPSSLSGYLIAAIDKIVGFYLLVRILKDIFIFKQNTFLMLIGALTIIIAVFMAINQHNLKKLLSYHSVSQVGYIILGISTGTTLGLIGGIFHMVNNTIYKTLLFLSSDIVEKTTGNVDLSSPKGLARILPYTFVFTLIAALSISGIPPFNGFFSKWIIYQAIVEKIFSTKSIVSILTLIIAMFGSALTLASFIKVIHSIFLSESKQSNNLQKEKFYSIFSMGILAILCLIFGIFTYEIPIEKLVKPMLNIKEFSLIGDWNSKVGFYILFVGFILGFIIYMSFVNKPRKVKNYLLGEEQKLENSNIPATDFYLTIVETYPFSVIYHFAEQKLLDFYNWFYGIISLLALITKKIVDLEVFDIYIFGKKVVFKTGEKLSILHNGNLHFYLSFVFTGILILLLIFIIKKYGIHNITTYSFNDNCCISSVRD
ncbi:MAG: complex I subunit 5 family protein [Endomicrobiia bacterium]